MNKLDRTSVNLFRSSPFVVNYYVYVCNNPYAKRMIKVTKLHFFSLVFRSIFPRKSSTVSSTVSRRIKSSFLFFFSPHFDYYLVSLPFPLHLSSSYSHEKRTLFVIFSYFFFSFSFFFFFFYLISQRNREPSLRVIRFEFLTTSFQFFNDFSRRFQGSSFLPCERGGP